MIYVGLNCGMNDLLENGVPINPTPLPTPVDGDVFISCNFARYLPSTDLFLGVSDLTFLNCNLTNVNIRLPWTVDDQCGYPQNDYTYVEELNEKKIRITQNRALINPRNNNVADRIKIRVALRQAERRLNRKELRIYERQLNGQ